MVSANAAVNWDSGHLHLPEVQAILRVFLSVSQGQLAGMDVVGDWSPVRLSGLMRRFFHWTMHPGLDIDDAHAARLNEETNLLLLETVQCCLGRTLSRAA